MQRIVFAVSGVSLLLGCAATACTDSTPPPATPTPTTTVVAPASPPPPPSAAASNAPPPATSVASSDPPPAATAADAGPDFYSCTADSDCVAVPTATCCPTGRKDAVNKQSTDAYASSVTCEKKHRICPMYRVIDKRVAVCGATSHKCEMKQPNEIPCGSAPNAHACPSGSSCDPSGKCEPSPTH